MQIHIPDFAWSPYGLIVVLSVVIGFAAAILLMRKFKVQKETILYTCILTFVCTIAISLFAAFSITENGIQIGFSGLGAVVGMVIGLFISALIIKDKPDIVMASFICTAPLMYGLAKAGCLLAGCCHGKPYSGPFALIYHNSADESYFPAQIIDMAVFITIYIISLNLVLRMKNKVRAIYIIIAILIPVRFVLEYLRHYHDGSLINSGQITVLIAGAAALVVITIWKAVLKLSCR